MDWQASQLSWSSIIKTTWNTVIKSQGYRLFMTVGFLVLLVLGGIQDVGLPEGWEPVNLLVHVLFIYMAAGWMYGLYDQSIRGSQSMIQQKRALSAFFHFFSLKQMYRLVPLVALSLFFNEGLHAIRHFIVYPDPSYRTWDANNHMKNEWFDSMSVAAKILFSYFFAIVAVSIMCVEEIKNKKQYSVFTALNEAIRVFMKRPVFIVAFFWCAVFLFELTSVLWTSSWVSLPLIREVLNQVVQNNPAHGGFLNPQSWLPYLGVWLTWGLFVALMTAISLFFSVLFKIGFFLTGVPLAGETTEIKQTS